MTWLLLTIVALFGLSIGSFLNVCIYRIPRDLSVVSPRSFCPECGKQLPWSQNIPVVSYLLLRGLCQNCSQSISVRYPIVELLTAILFCLIVWKYGFTLASCKWAVFECLLLSLFWTDLEERILPNEITLGGSSAGLLLAFCTPVPGSIAFLIFPDWHAPWPSIVNALSGSALLAVPIWLTGLIYRQIRKREGLGLGDVKLLVMIGIFLGPDMGFKALLFGVVGGAFVSLVFLALTRKQASSYELPLGSFLCLGAALAPFFAESSNHPLGVL